MEKREIIKRYLYHFLLFFLENAGDFPFEMPLYLCFK